MQVTNCTQSPNFGRLIISKEAQPALKKCSSKIIEKLISVGDYLEQSTEYFDVEIGRNLKCVIKGLKDNYFGPFISREFKNIKKGLNDDLLEMDNYTISRNPVENNPDEAVFRVVSSDNLGDIEDVEHIDELVLIATELDKAAIQKEKRSLEENVERKNAKVLRNRLLKYFGA